MIDLRGLVDQAAGVVDAARLAPGRYCRYADAPDRSENPYGCADAANILYTIGRFPRDADERASWVGALRDLQNPMDGLWHEATHHPIHTTAHCLGALELFDAGPIRPPVALNDYRRPESMARFLDGLDWQADPWRASHQGAGLYAALVLAGQVTVEWREAYFDWLSAEHDPETGLWRRGCVAPVDHDGIATRFPHLAGSFHYLFNQQYGRAPLPAPEALIDTCLDLRHADPFPLGRTLSFAEIDWVYCLNRATRQCDHRFGEAQAALADFAADYTGWLLALDFADAPALNDLHTLFGVLCALAELQQAVPGLLRSDQPLKLVLDRRPFI